MRFHGFFVKQPVFLILFQKRMMLQKEIVHLGEPDREQDQQSIHARTKNSDLTPSLFLK